MNGLRITKSRKLRKIAKKNMGSISNTVINESMLQNRNAIIVVMLVYVNYSMFGGCLTLVSFIHRFDLGWQA